jgi:membrane fusion protein
MRLFLVLLLSALACLAQDKASILALDKQWSDAIIKGDTATLLDQNLQARWEALQAEARSAWAQAQQREQALRDRLRSLQRDITQAQGELEATQQRVRMAQSNVARDQGLSQQGFLSAAQLQTRQEELLDMQVRERSAQRNLEALGREAQSVQAEMEATRLQAQGQQAQMARAQASLAQEDPELDARHVLHLVAPGPATVGTLAWALASSCISQQKASSLSVPPTGRKLPCRRGRKSFRSPLCAITQ